MKKSKNKQKKIIIIGQHYWPETFRVTDIAEGLVERGYIVDVLCGIPNYPAGKFFQGYNLFSNRKQTHNGVNIIRVPEIPRGDNSSIRIFLNYFVYIFFALLYLPKLILNRYDRIFVFQLSPVYMAFPGVILSKLTKIPVCIYICDFWPHNLFSIMDIKNERIIKLLTKTSYWHYKNADKLIAVYKGIQTRLVSDVGIDKNKTLYVAQAPEKIYEKNIYDKGLADRFAGNFNIVFAGNINPAQSFDVVTKAAKIVYDKGYHDIHYIIIGEGMTKKWLMDEVKKLGINKNFTFEGLKPVEDVPKYQTIADALIVALSRSPVFEYGIPAKMNSYMPSGKPIIGAIDGEGQKLINNYSGCGICVDSGDYKGMADAIIKLREMKPSDRKKIGARGKAYYKTHFERESNLTRLIEFVFNDKRIIDNEYDD